MSSRRRSSHGVLASSFGRGFHWRLREAKSGSTDLVHRGTRIKARQNGRVLNYRVPVFKGYGLPLKGHNLCILSQSNIQAAYTNSKGKYLQEKKDSASKNHSQKQLTTTSQQRRSELRNEFTRRQKGRLANKEKPLGAKEMSRRKQGSRKQRSRA